MDQLKLCPFCGGEAKLIQFYPYMGRRIKSKVCCLKCRANSGEWGMKNKAIETWNRREPIDKTVEQLKAQCGKSVTMGRLNGKTLTCGFYLGILKAIEIVKKGGAE